MQARPLYMMNKSERQLRMARRLTVEEAEDLLDETIDIEIIKLYEEATMQENVFLVRRHWCAMDEREQFKVCASLFTRLLHQHHHMRPYWSFSRTINSFAYDDSAGVEGGTIPRYSFENSESFRTHVKKVQGVLKLFIESMYQPHKTIRIMCELGERHFFYDAAEAHIQIIGEPLIASLKQHADSWDDRLEAAWGESFKIIVAAFTKGISVQRQQYLQHCITCDEILTIREHWKKIVEHGLRDAGQALCGAALVAYEDLCKQLNVGEFPFPIETTSEKFEEFAEDTVKAIGSIIECYDEQGGGGFTMAPLVCQAYCKKYMMQNICPSMLRKAFLEGVQRMVIYIMGEATVDEQMRMWNKMYRVFEQAVVINVMYP